MRNSSRLLILVLVLLTVPVVSPKEVARAQETVIWAGDATDSLGKSKLAWNDIAKSSEIFAGAAGLSWKDLRGYGTTSGTHMANMQKNEYELLMEFTLFDPPIKGCRAKFTGKVRFEEQSIVGDYSGVRCSTPVKNGHFSLTKFKATAQPK
jgi:hypothetical protein